MSNHTPGPWSRRGTSIVDTEGRPLAETRGLRRELPEHVANAALIAAAPMLLDACAQLLERLAWYYDADGLPPDLLAAEHSARAAIAAATGREE